MVTIWKYALIPMVEPIQLRAPSGAEFISCGLDSNNNICVWALVDSEAPLETKKVWCVGTGWPLNGVFAQEEEVDYIGAVAQKPYIWHILVGANGRLLDSRKRE